MKNYNYVEWGHYREKEKRKNFFIFGSDAYTLWHLAVRYKELLKIREIKKINQ